MEQDEVRFCVRETLISVGLTTAAQIDNSEYAREVCTSLCIQTPDA